MIVESPAKAKRAIAPPTDSPGSGGSSARPDYEDSAALFADAAKTLGVPRIYSPALAVEQLSSFHIDYAAVSANDESRLHARALASRVPYEPVTFTDVPVPRFVHSPANKLHRTLAVAPAFLVSYFRHSSAVHVRDLARRQQDGPCR